MRVTPIVSWVLLATFECTATNYFSKTTIVCSDDVINTSRIVCYNVAIRWQLKISPGTSRLLWSIVVYWTSTCPWVPLAEIAADVNVVFVASGSNDGSLTGRSGHVLRLVMVERVGGLRFRGQWPVYRAINGDLEISLMAVIFRPTWLRQAHSVSLR